MALNMKTKKTKQATAPLNLRHELSLSPAYLLLFVWLFITVAILLWIAAASLSTSKEIYSGTVYSFSSGLNFKNYTTAWKTQNVSVFFMNSLLYATLACVGVLFVAAPAAYVLSRFRFFGSKVIRFAFVIAMSVPTIMIILPLYGLATQLRLSGTRTLLVLLYIFINVPFTSIFLYNFFSSLSRTYEEAAAIDGCSPIKTFYRIMLPLAQPGVITISVFLFLGVWNEYFLALCFASSDKLKNVGIGLASMVSAMKYVGNLGGIFAAVVIVFLPTFLLYIFLSDKIIAGVTGGGVKG